MQKQPPGVPPTPSTITKDQPGGDANNPEVAAQERLLTEPWGMRADRQGVLMLGLPDPNNWRRVKFWLIDTFTGFRYGDDHHAVAALFLRDAPFAGADGDACLKDFEQWLDGQASKFDAQASEVTSETVRWRGEQLVIRKREASVRWGFSTKRYAAAYGSYAFWDGTCATLGYAVPMREDEALAIRVRDRLAAEGFSRLVARGSTKPLRDGVAPILKR